MGKSSKIKRIINLLFRHFLRIGWSWQGKVTISIKSETLTSDSSHWRCYVFFYRIIPIYVFSRYSKPNWNNCITASTIYFSRLTPFRWPQHVFSHHMTVLTCKTKSNFRRFIVSGQRVKRLGPLHLAPKIFIFFKTLSHVSCYNK